MIGPRLALSHVNVAPFVQQAARAFLEQGLLTRLFTTVVNRPDAPWQRAACWLSRFVKFDLSGQFQRRSITDVPDRMISDRPLPEMLRLLSARIDRSGVVGDLAHEWMETGFDRWISHHGLHGIDAIYSYENACSKTLKVAGRQGLFRIYDAPAPEYQFSRSILDAEVGQDSALNTRYQRHIHQFAREKRRNDRRQGEYHNADLIITASNVTRNSFVDYFKRIGRPGDIEKIVIVPYGAPAPAIEGSIGGSGLTGPMRFLWAGTFSLRKGARYLLQAWNNLRSSANSAILDVYGTVTISDSFLASLPDSIRFHGPVSRQELTNAYRAADLLVFPSLCDGFGMVATEALAQGLPVLTTLRAGAADLIHHGVNGFLIPPASSDAIFNTLEWAIANRPALISMRSEALKSAAQWQWSDYRRQLASIVCARYNAKLA